MNRPATRFLTFFLFCISALSGAAMGATEAGAVSEIPSLVNSLTDSDPAVRQRAADQLVDHGAAARAALLEATKSEDPELRARAAEILERLPWSLPEDPIDVRILLKDYGAGEPEQRLRVVHNLLERDRFAVAMRLLEEEPNATTRWAIVDLMAAAGGSEGRRRLRTLAVPAGPEAEAALLTLAGIGWLPEDRERALGLLHRAVEMELERPTSTPGGSESLIMAFERVMSDLLQTGRFAEAAGLLRRQVERGAFFADDAVTTVTRLFALHAYFGPLPGYREDLRRFGTAVGRPNWLDALLAGYSQDGAPLTTAMAPFAYATSSAVGEPQRLSAGMFFAALGQQVAAERELAGILEIDGGDSTLLDLEAHLRLAALYTETLNDAKVADHLEQAMVLRARLGVQVARSDDELRSEVHLRRLRIAMAAGDANGVERHLEPLLKLGGINPDATLEVGPLLRARRRDREAAQLFERTYTRLRSFHDADQSDPGAKNNLAWLCARSGERVEEGLRLAREAVEADPDNPAFLDTLAEAEFRAGNAAQAARLERRALEFRPNDRFMRSQLQRFEANQIRE